MVLNVGPDAKGVLPKAQVEIMEDIGKGMAKNGQSIVGCGPADLPKPDFGRVTRKGSKLYFHVFECPYGSLPIQGVDVSKVNRIRSLADGAELPRGSHFSCGEYPDTLFVDVNVNRSLPDDRDFVVEIELADDSRD